MQFICSCRQLEPSWYQAASGKCVANMSAIEFMLRKRLNFADGPGEFKVTLSIPRSHWIAVTGPSGGGKTTLLRLLAGLSHADEGHIRVGADCWLDTRQRLCVPTRSRRIGFVFQDHALFPHMTARRSLEFARPPGADAGAVNELLDLVGLAGLANQYPAQLSGGQQQRLAVARALAAEPAILLLDEPLSSLDARLRRDMQDLLIEIREQRRVSCAILVTHDDKEAARLVDQCLRMDRGMLRLDAVQQDQRHPMSTLKTEKP